MMPVVAANWQHLVPGLMSTLACIFHISYSMQHSYLQGYRRLFQIHRNLEGFHGSLEFKLKFRASNLGNLELDGRYGTSVLLLDIYPI